MINWKNLINSNSLPSMQDLNDCFDSFDLICGKHEKDCFDYANNKDIDNLLDTIEKYYSVRASKKDMQIVKNYIVANITNIYNKSGSIKKVQDLANAKKLKTRKDLKSLATKIMYFIDYKHFPIFDSNACKALIHIDKKTSFYGNKAKNIINRINVKGSFNYSEYKKIIDTLIDEIDKKNKTNLKQKTEKYRIIDKYLWIYGGNLD